MRLGRLFSLVTVSLIALAIIFFNASCVLAQGGITGSYASGNPGAGITWDTNSMGYQFFEIWPGYIPSQVSYSFFDVFVETAISPGKMMLQYKPLGVRDVWIGTYGGASVRALGQNWDFQVWNQPVSLFDKSGTVSGGDNVGLLLRGVDKSIGLPTSSFGFIPSFELFGYSPVMTYKGPYSQSLSNIDEIMAIGPPTGSFWPSIEPKIPYLQTNSHSYALTTYTFTADRIREE